MAEWASQFNGESYATELVGIAVDSEGDVALTGYVLEDGGLANGRKDAVIMKLSSANGDFLWRRNIGLPGTHDWGTAVASDASGNVVVAGQTDGNLYQDFSGGSGPDIWLAKLDGSTGEVMWRYQVGSEGQDVASTLAVDPDSGDIVVCGSSTGGLYDEKPKAFLESGLLIGGKDKGVEGGGTTLPFCAKLAEDGSEVWTSRPGGGGVGSGGGNDGILAAAFDGPSGDIFAAGYTTQQSGVQGSDYVIMRISGRDGSQLWRHSGGGGWMSSSTLADAEGDGYVQDSACALATDGRGDVVIAGNTEGSLFGNMAAGRDTDAFVAKFNGSDGSLIWGWQQGSGGNDYVNAVAVDVGGDVYACGAAAAGLFHDAGAGVSKREEEKEKRQDAAAGAAAAEHGVKEGFDVFLVKLDGRSGDLLWGAQFGSAEDDQASGIALGPPHLSSGGNGDIHQGLRPTDGQRSEDSLPLSLYLTGWTRGALYSAVPARWQDGWVVKLSNPPPETLRVTGALGDGQGGGGSGGAEALPTPGTTGAGTSAASDAARGAVTVGLVTSLIGMVTLVLAGLCLVLRRATNSGVALVPPRLEQPKGSLFRRRNRASTQDMGAMKGSGGGGKDNVEMKLLSDSGEGGLSTPTSSRHGVVIGSGGTAGRRDASPSSSNTPQPTFYI